MGYAASAAPDRADVPIPWRLAAPEEIKEDAFKFTRRNGGISVRMRGEPG
jgi:hypothetical protein